MRSLHAPFVLFAFLFVMIVVVLDWRACVGCWQVVWWVVCFFGFVSL